MFAIHDFCKNIDVRFFIVVHTYNNLVAALRMAHLEEAVVEPLMSFLIIVKQLLIESKYDLGVVSTLFRSHTNCPMEGPTQVANMERMEGVHIQLISELMKQKGSLECLEKVAGKLIKWDLSQILGESLDLMEEMAVV